jgi:prolipoprotein diacylglyceryltransferase
LEFFRGDKIRGMIGVLSTSQVISLLLIPAAVWLLFRKKATA